MTEVGGGFGQMARQVVGGLSGSVGGWLVGK